MEATQRLDSTEDEQSFSNENSSEICGSLTILNVNQKFNLKKGENFIGRDPAQCDIVLDNPSVSSLHAVIEGNENGCNQITDKKSTNGTYKGDLKLEPNVGYALKNGDVIRCGQVWFHYSSLNGGKENDQGQFLVPETPIASAKKSISNHWSVPDSQGSPLVNAKKTPLENVSLDNSSFLAPSQPSSMQITCQSNTESILDMETQKINATNTEAILNMETQKVNNTEAILNMETQKVESMTSLLAEETQKLDEDKTKGSQLMDVDDSIFDQPTQPSVISNDVQDEDDQESNCSEDLLGSEELDLEPPNTKNDEKQEAKTTIDESAVESEGDDEVFEGATQIEDPINSRVESEDSDNSSIDLIASSQEEVPSSVSSRTWALTSSKQQSRKSKEMATDVFAGSNSQRFSTPMKLPSSGSQEHDKSTAKIVMTESQDSDDLLGSTQMLMEPYKSTEDSSDDEGIFRRKKIEIPSSPIFAPSQASQSSQESDIFDGDDIPDFDTSAMDHEKKEVKGETAQNEENEDEIKDGAQDKAEITEPVNEALEETDIENEEQLDASNNDDQKPEEVIEKVKDLENLQEKVLDDANVDGSMKNQEGKEIKDEVVKDETIENQEATSKTENKQPAKENHEETDIENDENDQNEEEVIGKVKDLENLSKEMLDKEETAKDNQEQEEPVKANENRRSSRTRKSSAKLGQDAKPSPTLETAKTKRASTRRPAKNEGIEQDADQSENTNKRTRKSALPKMVTNPQTIEEPPAKPQRRSARPSAKVETTTNVRTSRKRNITPAEDTDNKKQPRKSNRKTLVEDQPQVNTKDDEKTAKATNENENRRSTRTKRPPAKLALDDKADDPTSEETTSTRKQATTRRSTRNEEAADKPKNVKTGRKRGSSPTKPDETENPKRTRKSAASKPAKSQPEPKEEAANETRKSNRAKRPSAKLAQEAKINESVAPAFNKAKVMKKVTVKVEKLQLPTAVVERKSIESRKKSKPIVMLTGYENPQDIKLIKELGGQFATKATECTVLITDKVRRTAKFLCALGRGIPIVSPNWLTQSKMTKTFLDPWKYLIQDEDAEKKWGFNLEHALSNASKNKLLDGYKVFATSSVLPSPKELKDIVISAGGEYLSKLPTKNDDKTFIISCSNDLKSVAKAAKAGIMILDKELLLTGLLKQKLEFDKHKLI